MRQIETDLASSESRYRALSDATFEAIFLSDKGVCIDANESACRLLGYTRDELIRIFGPDVFAPEFRDLVRQNMRSGHEGPYEAAAVRKDGTSFACEIQARMFDYGDGRRVRVTALRDITLRHDARREARRLAGLVDQSLAVVLIVDRDGRITYANRAGWTALELDGEDPIDRSFLIFVDGLASGPAAGELAEALAEASYWQGDIVLGPCASAGCVMRTTVSPLHDAEGGSPERAVTLFDITEQRRLEEHLRYALKMEAIGSLSGGIAHDFNNLITVINGQAEMLLGIRDLPREMRNGLETIRHSGERGATLASQLLAFSRRQVMKVRPLELNAVIRDLEDMLRRLIGEDVLLQVELEPTLPVIVADPGQLEQVLVNLVVNARDAVLERPESDGERRIIVVTRWREDPSRVEWTVTDTGIGMTDEGISHAFDPFYTTKRDDRGSGLGLSTVYGIVTQCGASIDIESTLGEGTTIRILWPASELPAQEVPSEEHASALQGTERVLVVEDDTHVRHFIARALESHGYEVREARNGREALDFVEGEGWDFGLVVSDVVMPDMGGRRLFERLGQLYPDRKYLMISGHTFERLIDADGLPSDMRFLAKPFSIRTLARTCRELLDA